MADIKIVSGDKSSDEELELMCEKALDRIMTDNRYFLHLLIKAAYIRAKRLCKEENNYERRR